MLVDEERSPLAITGGEGFFRLTKTLSWELNGSPDSIPFFFVIFVAFCEEKQKATKETKRSIAAVELALHNVPALAVHRTQKTQFEK